MNKKEHMMNNKEQTMSRKEHIMSEKTKKVIGEDKYMWLNNAELQVNPRIQRKLDPERVKKIANQFSPFVANPIKVSFRDGKYYIFDGMHTREAIRSFNDSDSFPIFCRVFYGLTEEDEAKLFSMQFGIFEDVTMDYKLRALEVAKDPNVLDFLRATREAGFRITLGSRNGQNGRVAAVCAAYKAYQDLGREEYTRMMKMIHKTWAGERWSVTKYMIAGMARFLQMYEVRIPAFVKAFRKVTYQEIRAEAARFPGMSKDGAYAAAIAEIFNENSTSTLKEVG